MTTTKRPAVKILKTLDEDPEVQFPAWELAIRNAATLYKTITPRGLLSVLLNDAQWDSYSTNSSINPQSDQTVIASRFTPPTYVECCTLCGEDVKRSAVGVGHARGSPQNCHHRKSGPVISQIIQHAEDGFTLMTIRDIMDKLRTKFGRMRKNTKETLKERMTARLSATELFDTHASTLHENFTISPIAENNKSPTSAFPLGTR